MQKKISSEEANKILNKYLTEKYLLQHSRETEVIMRALARHFGEDEELWGITGLLHDLDMEQIKDNLKSHGERTCEILKEEGYEMPEVFKAIRSHTESLGYLDVKRETKLDYCLSAAENITGLIIAYALVRPDKKLENITAKSIKKRMKEKAFAANVSREMIDDVEKAGIEKDKFLNIAINAMKDIASEIGF